MYFINIQDHGRILDLEVPSEVISSLLGIIAWIAGLSAVG